MTVASHINTLLHRHDCVIIPSFGAILTHKVSAQIHETTNTFYPPKKILAFNEQLHQNDGLLANYISISESCSYTEALEKIKLFISEINSAITEHGNYSLNKIGNFSKNVEGRLIFKPNNLNNFLTEAFGLSHFSCVPTSRLEKVQLDGSSVIPLHEPNTSNPKRNYLKYASIGLITLFVGGTLGIKFYSNHIQRENQISYEKAYEAVDRKIQEATFFLPSPIPTATFHIKEKEIYKPFHIIAGAFQNEQNASSKIFQLHQNGFSNAKSIGLNQFGLNQIAYDSYETRGEALNALHLIREKDNKRAWLLFKPAK